MKKWLRLAILTLFLGVPALGFSASSTSITAVTVSPNQPYLLETGWVNYGGTAGAQTIVTSKQCPTGFYPHINFSLFKLATSDVVQGTPGSAAVCPVAAYGTGASPYFYKSGTGYVVQFFTSGYQPSNIANAGILWEMNCFPGTTWLGAAPEYDTSCALPLLGSAPQFSQTYVFTNVGWVYENYRQYLVLTYAVNITNTSPFTVPISGAAGGIPIPYSGKYNFSVDANFLYTGTVEGTGYTTCFFFRLISSSGAFLALFTDNVGALPIYLPKHNYYSAGRSSASLMSNPANIQLNQGDVVFLRVQTAGGCGYAPALLLSNGSITVQRTGP